MAPDTKLKRILVIHFVCNDYFFKLGESPCTLGLLTSPPPSIKPAASPSSPYQHHHRSPPPPWLQLEYCSLKGPLVIEKGKTS